MSAEVGERRRRLPGVTIRPGSVKQARTESGLSLAQLAEGHLTRAAVHLVETGRSRPSMPTLQLIAARTGRPLSFFLPEGVSVPSQTFEVHDAALQQLETALLTEDYRRAADLGRQLLLRPLKEWSEARIRLHSAQAHLHLGELVAVRAHLEGVRPLAERLGDGWMQAEISYLNAVCLHLEEDPAAVPEAERALLLCRRLEPPPLALEVRILAHLAAAQIAAQSWEEGMTTYEAALRAGASLRDLAARAEMYEALSAVSQQAGDHRQAAALGNRALELRALGQDLTMIARTEHQLGLLLLRRGDLDGAEARLRSSLAHSEEVRAGKGRWQVVLSLGEVSLARGDLARSAAYAAEARDHALDAGDRAALAAAHQLLGRLAAAENDGDRSDEEFQSALTLLTEQGVSGALVECHATYARVLEERGNTLAALEQWKLAVGASRPELLRAETTTFALIG